MNSNIYRIALYVVGAIAVLAVGFVGLDLYFNQGSQTGILAWKPLARYIPTELVSAKRAGDNQKALQEYEAIVSDPNKEPEAKAMATINIANIKYHQTGDINDALEDIRNLKKIAVDATLTARTRAAAISALAFEYESRGRRPEVFTEIYNSAPFSNYLVPGNPDVSAMKLAEWSYEMRWASNPAIYVAQMSTALLYGRNTLDAATKAQYLATSEEYLQKAEDAAEKEAAEIPNYEQSDRYITYSIWKAITIGRLADLKGEPYKSQFRKEYDSFIAFAQTLSGSHAKDNVYFGRYQYAIALWRNDDSAAAKVQLDLIAQALNGLTDTTGNPYVDALKTAKNVRPSESFWTIAQEMFKISPEFKAAVERVTA